MQIAEGRAPSRPGCRRARRARRAGAARGGGRLPRRSSRWRPRRRHESLSTSHLPDRRPAFRRGVGAPGRVPRGRERRAASARAAAASAAATKTVSSPAIVPTASGSPASSRTRATGCAPGGRRLEDDERPGRPGRRGPSPRGPARAVPSRRSASSGRVDGSREGVAPRRLHEPELADVAGERRLGRRRTPGGRGAAGAPPATARAPPSRGGRSRRAGGGRRLADEYSRQRDIIHSRPLLSIASAVGSRGALAGSPGRARRPLRGLPALPLTDRVADVVSGDAAHLMPLNH